MDNNNDSLFAVCNIEGLELNGWHVKTKLPPPDTSKNETGGNFSICYIVEKDGIEYFMKAFDMRRCALGKLPDGIDDRLQYIEKCTREFNYEKDLSSYCGRKNIKRVITYVDSGNVVLPGFIFGDVSYIIYEKAEGDIRKILDFSKKAVFAQQLKDIILKLKSLHSVAVGIQQLHSNEISHQDMKPSNILSIRDQYKIGDLGKSLCLSKEINCPYPNIFNGDPHYAPPEAFFNNGIPKEKNELYQMDNYMLGSLIVFYISGVSFNALMSRHLPISISDMVESGKTYDDAKIDLINAYHEALLDFEKDIPLEDIREELTQIVEYLCNPDVAKRGHPKILGTKSRTPDYDLIRTYSELDKLFRKAEIILHKE